jgi:hypothetical protein
MAANGVYLTVMLQDEKRAVWRVFRMRDGVRLHDVSVQTFPHELRVWTFDVHRPAHCLLMGNVVGLWDGPFTLPSWMVGFWTGPQGTATTQPNPVFIGQQFSHALADVARMCLGAQKGVPFSIEGDELSSPIEKAIERFAHDGNFAAVHAYITFLPLILTSRSLGSAANLLNLFMECYTAKQYVCLRQHIGFTFLLSLDKFAEAEVHFTAQILQHILNAQTSTNFLFLCIVRSRQLAKLLTIQLIEQLCDLAFGAEPIYRQEATQLLRGLQLHWTSGASPLLFVYVRRIIVQFGADFARCQTQQDWEQAMMSRVSLWVFPDTLNQLEVSIDRIVIYFDTIDLLFWIASLSAQRKIDALRQLGLKALAVAFQLAFRRIESDRAFYPVQPHFAVIAGDEIDIEYVGLSTRLRDLLRTVVRTSYIKNIPNGVISEEIESLIARLHVSGLDEAELACKCEAVLETQPSCSIRSSSFLAANSR